MYLLLVTLLNIGCIQVTKKGRQGWFVFRTAKKWWIDGEMVGGLHSSNTSSMYPAPLTASHQRSKLRLTRSI